MQTMYCGKNAVVVAHYLLRGVMALSHFVQQPLTTSYEALE